METLKNIVITILGSTASIGIISIIFRDTIINIFKGNIEKDIEKFKGNINKDIEELKIKEGRTDILTTRYVETITNQRILWLEKIREDVSSIVGSTRIIIFRNEYIQNFITAYMFSVCNGNNPDVLSEYSEKMHYREEKIGKLVQTISKLKLRLNYISDTKLIKLLCDIEQGIMESKDKSEINKLLDQLVIETQIMLKVEWERVKDEVSEGKENKNNTVNN